MQILFAEPTRQSDKLPYARRLSNLPAVLAFRITVEGMRNCISKAG